jgi:hypothetical protein
VGQACGEQETVGCQCELASVMDFPVIESPVTQLSMTEFMLSEILLPSWEPLPKWSLSLAWGDPRLRFMNCAV